MVVRTRPQTRGAPSLASNEEAKFESLVRRQSKFVFRVAYAILRNSHDAEDAVQETFLKLYRNGAWTEIENERAFLARAAWRMAVDRLPQVQTEQAKFVLVSNTPSPEQEAIAADWHATVHRFVDALPEELRQPLALSTVDELNSREISEILGVPEGTVRTRLMRARQILRQKLTVLTENRHAR